MPVFTSKPSTDPGPFDALHPRQEQRPESAMGSDALKPSPDGLHGAAQNAQQKAHSALAAADEDSELDHLYRFQEIPVSADMRRELLGAKLPLASADQLADTQPPYKSGLSAPTGLPVVDRHAPTEPALSAPPRSLDRDAENGEPPLADTGRYSTTAPTLLSVRRRRLRNQRLVGLALAAMILAILSGVAWRRYTRQQDVTPRAASTVRPQAPRIAGNRPAAIPPKVPETQAGDPIEAHAVREPPLDEDPEIAGARAENTQPAAAEPDTTSSSPLSATVESASVESASGDRAPAETEAAQAATTKSTIVAPTGAPTTPKSTNAPSKRKAFDPEELIF